MKELELLSPAIDKYVAKEAILHGADAVYIGGPSHGARQKASNSLDDIKETVEFAHRFRAKVYVTVNTIVYENELEVVEKLIWDLYKIGVDALIIQDMGILRMSLPPIALHASTQCDTRTVAKAKFLEEVGFSQIVVARELTLDELKEICSSVTIPVECFIHGALCVSYSGRCGASHACFGRSANRGACAQICRLPFTLYNSKGEVLEKDKHLLSLKDLNASLLIPELVEAGVTSFKIEGRLKEVGYVKNVTASYRQIIDDFISKHPNEYRRSSYGESFFNFTPALSKSFNRGFTEYFIKNRNPESMATLLTPKSMGEEIKNINVLNNGDGISFFNSDGKYEGVQVNKVEKGKIISARPFRLPSNAKIYRTSDIEWQKKMAKMSATRKIKLKVKIERSGITGFDERGIRVKIPLSTVIEIAEKPQDLKKVFEKFGNSEYQLEEFINLLPPDSYLPPSAVNRLRRELIESLDTANKATYKFELRREENQEFRYPYEILDSRDNVANSKAEEFYESHGVKSITPALERLGKVKDESVVMTTRYCLRRELGCCKKKTGGNKRLKERYSEPLSIVSGNNRFILEFDCERCEMNVKLKKGN